MQETKHQKALLQDFAPQNFINHRVLNLSESHLPSSSSRPFPRRILHPDGYAGQHVTLLPESPSPICCHPFQISSSDSDTFYYSDIDSHLPSPRNQSFGKSCVENNYCCSCYCEIEEWLENANKFCKPNNFMTRYYSSSDSDGDSLDQNGRSPEVKLSMSSICKKILDHELYSNTLPSVKESTAYESQSHLACINSIHGHCKSERDHQGRRKLLSRPKPYNTYLNEIEMKKLEIERDSWKRARYLELLERMRRKEAAIDDWESEQTRIAVEKMKKLQDKLETKQHEIASKTQKKLCSLKQKAEKQKRKLRRTTIEKISTTSNISGTDTCSCRGFTCLRLGSFC